MDICILETVVFSTLSTLLTYVIKNKQKSLYIKIKKILFYFLSILDLNVIEVFLFFEALNINRMGGGYWLYKCSP